MSGAFVALLRISMPQSVNEGLLSQILGPLGALAFAVVTVWFLVRYLQRKEKRLEDLQDNQLKEALDDAKYWREIALGKKHEKDA